VAQAGFKLSIYHPSTSTPPTLLPHPADLATRAVQRVADSHTPTSMGQDRTGGKAAQCGADDHHVETC
jgi:hypothetical protein